MKKRVVISLGGSVIIPKKLDTKFLKNFKKIILKYLKKDYKFAIYCGGGYLARRYQKYGKEKLKLNKRNLDWLGIYATRINAFFLKQVFKEFAEQGIITNPTKKIKSKKKILIAAGWKPGWSTDYDAILLAKNLGVKKVVNVTNVDYVYDKNPKKYKNAKAIKEIRWKDFKKLAGDVWKPGLNMPFDPIAAKAAERLRIEVYIVGKNLKNLDNLLSGKRFKGTKIR